MYECPITTLLARSESRPPLLELLAYSIALHAYGLLQGAACFGRGDSARYVIEGTTVHILKTKGPTVPRAVAGTDWLEG